MSVQKLKKAPLKEVIFELYWEGLSQQNDIMQDPGFENAIGKLQERLEVIAPIQKRLYPLSGPVKVFGLPVFQYWKGELKWPVIQHGPGMFTVNDTELNYVWADTYKPLVLQSLDVVIASYGKPLPFNRVTLKYIDAIDVSDNDLQGFVGNNFQIRIENKFELPGKSGSFNLLQRFELSDGSTMQLQISSGVNNENNSPAVVWATSVEKVGKISKEDIIIWLETAHDHSSKIFKTMLKPEFYDSLDK